MKCFLPNLAAIKPTLIIFFLLLSFKTLFSQESMRASLYINDANGQTLVDGNFTNYDDIYCNCVDWDDAWKMTNPGENFGLLRENVTLVVERRKIIDEKDTTTFHIWNLQQSRNYSIVILNQQLDHLNLFAFFKDNYLGTSVPVSLNGNSVMDFNIDANPASYGLNRFQLIFEKIQGVPLPVSFTGVKTYRQPGLAMIEWQVENEISISKYIVEKSIDGLFFNIIQEVKPVPIHLKGYQSKDNYVSHKENFYRIRAISIDGKEQVSATMILHALTVKEQPLISVYPNPVVNKKLQLEFAYFPEGKYVLKLIGVNGIICNLYPVIITASHQLETLFVPRMIPVGIYKLVIMGEQNVRINTTVNIL